MMNEVAGIKILSFLAGVGLGWIHFRLYHHMLNVMMTKPENTPFRKLAVVAGLFRHIFILLAGICLIRGARLEPFPLCGGLLFATVAYRVYVLRLKPLEGDQNR